MQCSATTARCLASPRSTPPRSASATCARGGVAIASSGTSRARSGRPHAVAENAPHGARAVAVPAQLLALLDRPRLVRDADLAEARAATGELVRDLDLDAEAVLAQVEVAREAEAENLVAGL